MMVEMGGYELPLRVEYHFDPLRCARYSAGKDAGTPVSSIGFSPFVIGVLNDAHDPFGAHFGMSFKYVLRMVGFR